MPEGAEDIDGLVEWLSQEGAIRKKGDDWLVPAIAIRSAILSTEKDAKGEKVFYNVLEKLQLRGVRFEEGGRAVGFVLPDVIKIIEDLSNRGRIKPGFGIE